MATQNKNIKVTELDFDEIKSNLKMDDIFKSLLGNQNGLNGISP